MSDAVVGVGVPDGYLTREQVETVARDGLGALPVDGRRVLVIIPDGTRTMPMPLMFELLERQLGPRVAALDYLVALGTHSPMSDAQLSRPRWLPGRERAAPAPGTSSIIAGTIPPRSRIWV